MWLKLMDGRYRNVENGLTLLVQATPDSLTAVETYRVALARDGYHSVTVQEGYKTDEDAHAALAELMSASGFQVVELQPPYVTEEEGE